MNKQDQIVFFEELSRAAALLTLKKQCNEQEYKTFVAILENYENNLTLTESKVQGSEKYNGFLNFFTESRLLQEATIPNIDVFQRLDAETQAKVLEKMPEGDQKEEYKKVAKTTETNSDLFGFRDLPLFNKLPEEDQKKLVRPISSAVIEGKLEVRGKTKEQLEIQLAEIVRDSTESLKLSSAAEAEALGFLEFMKSKGAYSEGGDSGEVDREPTPEEEQKADQEADKIEAAAEQNPDPLASELGKLAAQYVDNYGGFFNQLATNIWGLFNPRKFQQYRRQQILGLLAMLKKQAGEAGVPGSDKIETGQEAVEAAQEEAESEGEVAATIPKDTKLPIRKNVKDEDSLVNVLRANGFKGSLAKKIAQRFYKYFKRRGIPVKEAIENGTLDRMLLEVKKANLLSEKKKRPTMPKRKKVNKDLKVGDWVRYKNRKGEEMLVRILNRMNLNPAELQEAEDTTKWSGKFQADIMYNLDTGKLAKGGPWLLNAKGAEKADSSFAKSIPDIRDEIKTIDGKEDEVKQRIDILKRRRATLRREISNLTASGATADANEAREELAKVQKKIEKLEKGTGTEDDLEARDRKNQEEYEAEIDKLRKYVRMQGKRLKLGVFGKILSRAITAIVSENPDLIDSDPKLRKVLKKGDEIKFNKRKFKDFTDVVSKSVIDMFKKRGYTDKELEKMKILEYVENNLKLLILENNRDREIL